MAGRVKYKNYLVVLVVVLLLSCIAAYSCWLMYVQLTDLTLSRRTAIAELTANTIKDKLDQVVSLGISIADRPSVEDFLVSGKWEEAVNSLGGLSSQFSYIDSIALFDPAGTMKAVAPPIPEIIGQSFAYRDYYQGVSKEWKPYVSEVFKRAPVPRYNLVSVAVPVKSKADQKVLGIVLLTIKLDTITNWTKAINIGGSSFIYIVDAKGHVAAHPNISSLDPVVDYSQVPVVNKLLRGEHGIEVLYNQIDNQERLSAFEAVPGYGWGVVVTEPTAVAFAERDRQTLILLGVWLIILFIVAVVVYRTLRDRQLLQSQNDREHLLMESIGDGVFAIDRLWNILLWNKTAERLTGFKASEAIGRPFREVVKFVNVDSKKENIIFIEEAMLYGEARSMSDHTVLITKDGRELPVGDSCSPIFDGKGSVEGAIIIFRDISAEYELKAKEKELLKMKDDFLFRTVHDLRAPSNIVRLALKDYFDVAEVSKASQQLQEGVEFIKEANNRMTSLIEELLSIGRGENPERVLKKDPIDLPLLINDLVLMSKPAIEKKKVIFNHVLVDDLPKIAGDAEALKEVFGNLVDNSIKYNKEGGQVTISYEPQGQFLLTYVQDTGVGIASDSLNKLFAPYFRAYTGKDIQGTGLGLYIVKKLIESMGGKISVSSTLDQGTKFTIYLPLA